MRGGRRRGRSEGMGETEEIKGGKEKRKKKKNREKTAV